MSQSKPDPKTSCHNVEAVVVGGSEGTNHYECPVCHESVNADGSRLDPMAEDELYNILDETVVKAWFGGKRGKGGATEIALEAYEAINVYTTNKIIDCLNRFNLPEYDHTKCIDSKSCIGYENARSDFDNEKEILIRALTKGSMK